MWHNTFNDLPIIVRIVLVGLLFCLWLLLFSLLEEGVGMFFILIFYGALRLQAETVVELQRYAYIPLAFIAAFMALRIVEEYVGKPARQRFMRYIPKDD